MTESEKQFDSAFKRRGGFCNIDELFEGSHRDTLQAVLDGMNNALKIIKYHYPNLPEIYINFTNDFSLNAGAILYHGKHLIGINLGAFYVLFDMFMKMFATKEILPSIGNASMETADEKDKCFKNRYGVAI